MKINYAPISVAVEKVILKHESEMLQESILRYIAENDIPPLAAVAIKLGRMGALVAQAKARIEHAAKPDWRGEGYDERAIRELIGHAESERWADIEEVE